MRSLLAFRRSELACLTLLLAFCSLSDAQEWTRFRGPNGTGLSKAQTIPAKWEASDLNWSVELPGIGHSSPVVWGQRLFILSANPDNATRFVDCIDTETGARLWTREYSSKPHHLHTRSSYASCTPAVDAEQVYVAWSTPEETTLKALDHQGEEKWSLNLGPWVSQHGFGTSPIVYENLVILSNSQQAKELKEGETPGKSFMMAFDRKSGKQVWSTPRVSVNVCYSVPFIYQAPGGQPELISISTGNGMYSLDPLTGKENWSIDLFKMRTVGSPILAGGLIFGTTGSGGGGNYVCAVRPGKKPELVYEIKTQAPYVPTLVAKDDLAFLFFDKGFVTCINPADGQVHWKERLDTAFSGSPIVVDNKVYCIDEDGVVFVIAAEPEFKLLAKNPLGEPSRSTPCVSGGRMYLRTYSHLFSVGGKAS